MTLTSVGVMGAVELGVPKERFRKALDYLKANAKTFEEVRIAAGAVEAWGVKDYPFDLTPWLDAAAARAASLKGETATDARELGSVAALLARLGSRISHQEHLILTATLTTGQRDDGGWGKAGEKASDLESTYRVMRALKLLDHRPNAARLRAFVASCRNPDGGYGVKPGDPSAVGPTYYAAIVLHWLADMEK